jgi:hypothetical protein
MKRTKKICINLCLSQQNKFNLINLCCIIGFLIIDEEQAEADIFGWNNSMLAKLDIGRTKKS